MYSHAPVAADAAAAAAEAPALDCNYSTKRDSKAQLLEHFEPE